MACFRNMWLLWRWCQGPRRKSGNVRLLAWRHLGVWLDHWDWYHPEMEVCKDDFPMTDFTCADRALFWVLLAVIKLLTGSEEMMSYWRALFLLKCVPKWVLLYVLLFHIPASPNDCWIRKELQKVNALLQLIELFDQFTNLLIQRESSISGTPAQNRPQGSQDSRDIKGQSRG